jgi:hypothetical protein
MAGASKTNKKKSDAPMIIGAVLGIAVFATVTYVAVDVAGGTSVETNDSNTPNGVTVGPPSYK